MTPLVEAWQDALAAEQQAAFGYGLLGPRLSTADQGLAVTCSDAHEQLRNATETALAAAGQTPVPPLADYPMLYPVSDDAGARRLAVHLEDACAEAWRYLYLQAARPSERSLRTDSQAALTASAVRAARWRQLIDPARATVPFPGV